MTSSLRYVPCVSLLLILLTTATLSCETGTLITVTHGDILLKSRTFPTLQVVTNPLLADDAAFHSPIYSTAWKRLAELPVKHPRVSLWFPFGARSCAAMEPPSPASIGRCVGPVQSGFNLTLDCEAGVGAIKGNVIKSIDFSFYGLPVRKMDEDTAMCQGFEARDGACSSPNAAKIQQFIEKQCIGKSRCKIQVPKRGADPVFGSPCPQVKEPMRLAVLAQCRVPYNYSSWDFSLMDQMLVNFGKATKGSEAIVNIPTQPMWAFDTPVWSYIDSPNRNNALQKLFGKASSSPSSLARIGNYYRRVYQWYTKGGFRDEFGRMLHSGLHLDFDRFEIMNEPDAEHRHTAKTYTDEYDATVQVLRKLNPAIVPVGLSLAFHTKEEEGWLSYFLNESNHKAGVLPLGWISYHFYAKAPQNTPQVLETLFARADEFLVTVRAYERIRKALAPSVKTTLNELGAFAPTSNLYWTAASGLNAYLYLKLALESIDVVGWSQLVANPSMPELGLPSIDPSVAMLSYKTGEPNQRYWTLKLLALFTGPGFDMHKTSSSTSGLAVQYFQNATMSTLVVINKKSNTMNVCIQGLPMSPATMVYTVDEHTQSEPKPEPYTGELKLLRFAVQVVTFVRAEEPLELS